MTKEQLEDRAFAQMLLWVATAVVVEVVMLLLNRFQRPCPRQRSWASRSPMYKVLTAFPIVGTILFLVVFLVAGGEASAASDSLHETAPCRRRSPAVSSARASAACCCGTRRPAIAPMVLVVVPALGVLMMVDYLYQREFFASVLVGALGLLGLWMFLALRHGNGNDVSPAV